MYCTRGSKIQSGASYGHSCRTKVVGAGASAAMHRDASPRSSEVNEPAGHAAVGEKLQVQGVLIGKIVEIEQKSFTDGDELERTCF